MPHHAHSIDRWDDATGSSQMPQAWLLAICQNGDHQFADLLVSCQGLEARHVRGTWSGFVETE
jgi:hypothetical protein